MTARLPLSAALAAALLSAISLHAAEVDYLRDIKPLLTEHCVRCHGADKEEAGLRLDTGEWARFGGYSGNPVRHRTGEESLLLEVVLGTHEDIPAMPYKKPALDASQVTLLRQWVKAGAPSPDDEEPGRFLHWAYAPPVSAPPPEVRDANWPRTPVDHFILARLEAEGIAPSPEADRVTLLRRVSLDLTGLPPTPAEVDTFLRDTAPGAYERAVDRLLASPHHGERWARPWLDVARYADSNGYSIDAPRQIWKYRDWVVDALNRDVPFDQFVIEQLAGDLLPEPTMAQRIATGFNRNTQINEEGGIDPEQFRIEAVFDRTNTFGTAFLGLTVACAQCHDHKFDQLSHKEYYQLFAFFNSTVPENRGVMTFPGEFTAATATPAELAAAREELERYLEPRGGVVATWIPTLSDQARAQLRPNLRGVLDKPWAQLSLTQRRGLYSAARPDDEDFRELSDKLTQIERAQPRPVTTLVMEELPEPRDTVIFTQGDFTRPAAAVTPGVPAVLPPLSAEKPNRLDLARWVVDPAHPLTARVAVNRVWQQYFGRGIVETENDFGTQGTLPTHPELLDWLATEFVARGWSMKALHRLIVTSAVYRQSSDIRPDLADIDPRNYLLARQTRLRLDAEIVRDVALAASGLFEPTIGGPPVFPPQPDGVMNLGQVKRAWNASEGENRYRRGLYTHFWRATPHPALAVFDVADGFSACTRRLRSNTPLQALTLLNDRQFFEFALALAERVQREAPGDLDAQLEFAFRTCLARSPEPDEHARLKELFHQQYATSSGDEAARRNEAWTIVARVLLNLDETITRE
jgi:mono/diheme cytochrome c family protein